VSHFKQKKKILKMTKYEVAKKVLGAPDATFKRARPYRSLCVCAKSYLRVFRDIGELLRDIDVDMRNIEFAVGKSFEN